MIDFVMHHTYSSISGWFGVILSVAALIYLAVGFNQYDNFMKLMLIFIGVLFTIINPLMLRSKAKKQVTSNKSFETPIDNTMTGKF